MAFLPNQKWYCGSTKYAAVTAWAASTVYAVGAMRKQLATPAFGSERVFVCIVAGTSGGTEPTWVLTQGAKTTDNTVTWQEVTGKAAVNGDLTNTSNWNSVKSTNASLGLIIQRISGGSLQICTTSGVCGSGAEPSFSNTAGVTTNDGAAVWTSLGSPSNYAAWAAPWATLGLVYATGAFTLSTDQVFVSNNHAATSSSALTYTARTVDTTVYCVNDSAVPPTALATTASETTTGASAISIGGSSGTFHYMYGLNFNCSTGATGANLLFGYLGASVAENCTFKLLGTGATNNIILGNTSAVSGSYVGFKNCTFTFSATTQYMTYPLSHGLIQGGSIAATGSAPAVLFNVTSAVATGSDFRIMDCDLSTITGSLFNSSGNGVNASVENCKINATTSLNSAAPTSLQTGVFKLHNSDSSATNYRYAYARFPASVVSETSIVRSGGASDGVTPLSWKVITGASSSYFDPFVTEEIAIWNDTSGASKTATIEITTSTALTNADCWLEVEYPSSASSPIGATVDTKKTILATAAALTTSSVTWNGTAQTYKYTMSVTFTPQMKGVIKGRVYAALASTTIYVDPLLTIA